MCVLGCAALPQPFPSVCLSLFAYRMHRQRPLVVAANRDEYYARSALAAHWWDDAVGAGIFGGRDLAARGTWLAVAGDGRVAGVTNWTHDRAAPPAPRSRGDLARDFLAGRGGAREFADAIDGERYAGFNFLAYDGADLVYASNRTGEVRSLPPGVYGLTNTRLGPGLYHGAWQRSGTASGGDRPWPKAVFGALALHEVAAHATPADLIEMLAKSLVPLETPADREQAPERSYSPCFIHGAEYGTRASTAIVVGNRSLDFVEQQYGPFGKPGRRSTAAIPLAPHRANRSAADPRRSDPASSSATRVADTPMAGRADTLE